jgi:hypothetical protein
MFCKNKSLEIRKIIRKYEYINNIIFNLFFPVDKKNLFLAPGVFIFDLIGETNTQLQTLNEGQLARVPEQRSRLGFPQAGLTVFNP